MPTPKTQPTSLLRGIPNRSMTSETTEGTEKKEEAEISYFPCMPLFIQKKQRAWETSYGKRKKDNPETDKLLKKIFYATTGAVVTYLFNEYIETSKKLTQMSIALNSQARETTVKLETIRALRVQPFYWITTSCLTEQDNQDYLENRTDLTQRIHQLKSYKNEIEEYRLFYVFFKFPLNFNINLFFIFHNRFIRKIETNLDQQINQLETVRSFNESIWLQKNHRYKEALDENKENIDKLESYKKNKVVTCFDLSQALAAAYNAQAKLQACLAAFSSNEKEEKEYKENSLNSYSKAIAILEELTEKEKEQKYTKQGREKKYLAELATLFNSQAYLYNSLGDLETAGKVRHRAYKLKPNDEYILCGMGLDLLKIEEKKLKSSSSEPVKIGECNLDKAYGYFNRALQLNDKIPNIYFHRGCLLKMMGGTVAKKYS